MNQVHLYLCGMAKGNIGAWSAMLEFGPHQKELFGSIPGSSEGRMDLFAAISGLGALKMPCEVLVFTEHNTLRQGLTNRKAEEWKARGWKNEKGEAVPNSELWFLLLNQSRKHVLHFESSPAMTKMPQLLRCNELARQAIADFEQLNGTISVQ